MKKVLMMVAVLIVGAAAARAQGCLYNSSPCEAYASADAVFVGKVTRVVQPGTRLLRHQYYSQSEAEDQINDRTQLRSFWR